VKGTAIKRRCTATNKRGEPCGARAVTAEGLCAADGGLTDMRAIGAAGGRGSVRSRLGLSDEIADESLREKARRRLEKVLDGDDEAAALRAGQSLYSYRAAQPPVDHERREEGGAYLASGRKVISLADILELCLDEATASLTMRGCRTSSSGQPSVCGSGRPPGAASR
jgi:hypothetical protein